MSVVEMRPLRLPVWLLIGCGATPPASVVVTPTLNAPPDPCASATGLRVEAPEAIAGDWDGGTITGGHGTVTIRWCGAGAIAVERMSVEQEGRASARYDFDPATTRLAHGEHFDRDVMAPATPQALIVTVTARDDAGTEIVARATTRSAMAPAFVAERDACVAAGGTFSPEGMMGRFACDRPTHDAGQRCLSSADCEGPCLDDHVETSSSPPPSGPCPSGEIARVHVGTCASHSPIFGCGPRLDAPSIECVRPGAATRTHTVCVD